MNIKSFVYIIFSIPSQMDFVPGKCYCWCVNYLLHRTFWGKQQRRYVHRIKWDKVLGRIPKKNRGKRRQKNL